MGRCRPAIQRRMRFGSERGAPLLSDSHPPQGSKGHGLETKAVRALHRTAFVRGPQSPGSVAGI